MTEQYRSRIAPLPEGGDRPLWSIMIPSYNCAQYLGETLESVLAQDMGTSAMQIEVVDDASTDNVHEVVQKIGQGRVSVYQHAANVGQIANFTECLRRSRGNIVHLLHGDDRVRPGFYAAMTSAFHQDPDIGAAFCRWSLIDGDGKLIETMRQEQPWAGRIPDALACLASEQRITTPSIAVRRSVWETLGSFDSRLECAEDWEMWVRIAAHYPVWYEPAPLAEYRQRPDSTTDRNSRSARELHFTARAIDMMAPILPAASRAETRKAAREAYARSALEKGHRYYATGDLSAARAHALAALHLSRSAGTLLRALRLGFRTLRARSL
ncbi:glycosyltransferase [Sphingobium phenoxybenzoativorans]|uniref:Glycosyltransferase n=1 Tax=Sphingobium phenoxybenzoativorans TaxID=1592790 RepID=A0A975K6H0_9SPHN|nr:glycosyltransferase [Sphingobium phenoxybenzoativorans]QUT05685.1 glycosyltransferase [Sphingobium phenoxybenzoativorans]